MFKVGDLKKLINDLPDETLIIVGDPFSEFSFDILEINKGFTKLDHKAINGKCYYNSWCNDDFNNFLEDNSEDEKEIKKEYKPSLIIYLK